MTNKTGEHKITGKPGSGKHSRHLFIFLFLSLFVTAPVSADWNVNLSNPQTNENLTVTAGRLVLGLVNIATTANATYSQALISCDEGAGPWCYDQTSFNNSAQVTNANWSTDTPAGSGAALEFTGSEYATILTNISNDLPVNFSYGAFYNYTNTDGLNHSIMNNGIVSAGSFFLFIDNGKNKTWCKYFDSGAAEYAVPLSSSVTFGGSWHQAICVINATHLSIFHDGVFNNSIPHGGNPTTPQVQAWDIGVDLVSGTYGPFYGLIDEVGIWNHTLNETHISDLWNEKRLFFLNETTVNATQAGSGYAIYNWAANQSFVLLGSTITQDNNANLSISYSVYKFSWTAYTTDIGSIINENYAAVRVKVTMTDGNATNPWVSAINLSTGTGLVILSVIIYQIGTIVDAVIVIIPKVIITMVFLTIGGGIVAIIVNLTKRME